jgi:peptidoglycan/xylan/chitin deacetylase (PgdA/CDA1 family)
MSISLTFDVEPDLHTNDYKGVEEGLFRILNILDKYNIKATFFTTCDCIEKFPLLFKKLAEDGHEVALHSFSHSRFDELSNWETEADILSSLKCFNLNIKQRPFGFRAPQHSVDDKTLFLLRKYGFVYDSSYAPLNLLQLLFFPNKFKLWFKQFFSPRRKYLIKNNLYEISASSLFIPFVSIVFRAFPQRAIRWFYKILKFLNKNIVFYAHSWDFIDMPQSRIARTWPKETIIKNLDLFIRYSIKKDKFCRMIDFVN